MQREKLIAIGHIVTTRGIKGELKVLPLTDYPERFKGQQRVYLTKDDTVATVEIENTRYHRGMAIVKFKGYDTIGESEKLKGMSLEVDEADAVKLPSGVYFIHDIVGLKVYSEEEEYLGEVVEVMTTAGNDVYVVEGDRGEILIPAIHEVVLNMDVATGKMIVRPMEGLIEP